VFVDLDCTLLEFNPFTLDGSGAALPLDVRMELDDTARFRSGSKWGTDLEFPLPFGRTPSPAEAAVAALDDATGASLKFTVLNPQVSM
jgi:ATP citrate (pro-S)-lyase